MLVIYPQREISNNPLNLNILDEIHNCSLDPVPKLPTVTDLVNHQNLTDQNILSKSIQNLFKTRCMAHVQRGEYCITLHYLLLLVTMHFNPKDCKILFFFETKELTNTVRYPRITRRNSASKRVLPVAGIQWLRDQLYICKTDVLYHSQFLTVTVTYRITP